MQSQTPAQAIRSLRDTKAPVIGCFPLYPPLELLSSMNLVPVTLWGLKPSVNNLFQADKHVQNYACSVARELTQFVLSETGSLLDGLFSYNACDTLRNLPEILEEGHRKKPVPMFKMHVPQVHSDHTNSVPYLQNEIRLLIRNIQNAFGCEFSSERFLATTTLYQQMRALCQKAEQLVATGNISFGAFCNTILGNYFACIEDQIVNLNLLVEKAISKEVKTRTNSKKVMVSGIMPPPFQVTQAMDNAGLVVAANDIAALARSYAYNPPASDNPETYYADMWKNRFPCSTILYQSDAREDAFLQSAKQSKAKGVIFFGEKFCECEYFEFPYLENRLKEMGIPSLFCEFGIDDSSNTGGYTTRIEAFAEML